MPWFVASTWSQVHMYSVLMITEYLKLVTAHLTLPMILILDYLHSNSYDVNLKSPEFLALSSVCALILLITILKFLFSILPLKCFCTTYKRYTSIHLTSQSTYAIPQFPNLTIFTRGNCWKVSMAFPSLFWQFHLTNELIFANWHSGSPISMSPTGSCD